MNLAEQYNRQFDKGQPRSVLDIEQVYKFWVGEREYFPPFSGAVHFFTLVKGIQSGEDVAIVFSDFSVSTLQKCSGGGFHVGTGMYTEPSTQA
jgi:hypothetical protein